MMTEPLNVDPSQLRNIAGRWYVLLDDLHAPPPTSGAEGWPSHGVQAVTGVAGESTEALQQKLAGTAGSALNGADAYQNQEGQSTATLGGATGPMSDIAGLFGTIGGLIEPLATEAASFGGQLLSTGSSLGTSLANLAKGNSASTPETGIGLPPANQDQHHSVDQADAAAAAPQAKEQHSEVVQFTREADYVRDRGTG